MIFLYLIDLAYRFDKHVLFCSQCGDIARRKSEFISPRHPFSARLSHSPCQARSDSELQPQAWVEVFADLTKCVFVAFLA